MPLDYNWKDYARQSEFGKLFHQALKKIHDEERRIEQLENKRQNSARLKANREAKKQKMSDK